MTTTDDIRRWAMALPEVEGTSHFRFHVPVFKIRAGRSWAWARTRQRRCSDWADYPKATQNLLPMMASRNEPPGFLGRVGVVTWLVFPGDWVVHAHHLED